MTRDDEVFGAALRVAGPERHALLDQACAGDAALRARVEALLRGHERAVDFLKGPISPRCTVVPQEQPGDVIDRYELVERIGAGGCGVVWSADQTVPVRRRVALKLIKLGMDTREVIVRFEAERQALALMDHPGIARVFDGGSTAAGRPYFVMELVRGVTITKYCDEHRLTPTQRIELFIQVCHAVQHAHQKGIIHRDLKPSNILVVNGSDVGGVSPPRGDGPTRGEGTPPTRPIPKVIDFGIAKATQGRLTDETLFTALDQFIGTPVYMSPEQAGRGSTDIDTRSDIYSLGVLLYELLAGAPPFDAKSLLASGVDEIRRVIREVEPARPSTRVATLGEAERITLGRLRGTAPAQLAVALRGDLDWIVMRCLEKERTRRYETANALAMDLRRHLAHEPVIARPPGSVYVLRKLVRRHRWAFVAAFSIVAVLALGIVASTSQAVRATRAEREQTRLRVAAEAQELAARRRAYVADINRLQQALATDSFEHARELLNRQRPQPGEHDLRGWEWRYFWQFCRDDSTALLSQKEDSINVLALSSDGNWLAYIEERTLWLQNLQTREEVKLSADAEVHRIAFAPREPLLAIAEGGPAGKPHRLRLWDAMARRTVREWPLPGYCAGIVFSENGETLFTSSGGGNNRIEVWRVADGGRLASHPAPMDDPGFSWGEFAVTRDHTLAAHTTLNGAVRVIDLRDGTERCVVRASVRGVNAIAFSPDGKTLVTGPGLRESDIRLWESTTGREIGRLVGHRNYVRALLFTPDGRTLVSAGRDQTVRIWNLETKQLVQTLRGHRQGVSDLCWLPDGHTLLSGASDGTIRQWDLHTPAPPAPHLELEGEAVQWHFAADSRAVLSVERAGNLVRWHGDDFKEREVIMNLGAGHLRREMAEIAADIPLVALGDNRGIVRIWDWQGRRLVREIDTGGRTAFPIGFLPRGASLLIACGGAGGQPGSLQEWNLTTGRKIRSWRCAGSSRDAFAVSRDGMQCLILNERGTSSIIDLMTGTERTAGIRIQERSPVSFSPDGQRMAAPVDGSGKPPRIWDAASLQRVTTPPLFGSRLTTISVAFSPEGGRLAMSTAGGGTDAIWLADTESFESLMTLEAGGTVFQPTFFSPNGNVIGSLARSGQIDLWRAPSWDEIEAAEASEKSKPPRPRP